MDQQSRIIFLVPADVKEQAQAKATREDLTLAQVLRYFLRAWLAGQIVVKRRQDEEGD